ncbi:MAG: ABC transporter ATP-binding protein [Thermomicrobiales bacterium]
MTERLTPSVSLPGTSRRSGSSTEGGRAATHLAFQAGGADVVQTRALTKRYGDQIAVDALDLTVRSGEVYGFLGPNGAGKTTTLRMLVGLIRPTSGEASVLGAAPGTPESLARIGAMIETPAFYPFLSGEDNLRVLARYAEVPASRIGNVLEQVDLLNRAGDPFKSYSLGMKQRLGVAAALLKDPALLILDEPTNGLDPAGMAEMRALIRELGQGDRTVLLSSHLMHEIEQISDRVGIVARGRLVAEGTVDDLRGDDHLVIRVDPDRVEIARDLLAATPDLRVTGGEPGVLRVESPTVGASRPALLDAAAINTRLVTHGVAVHELRPERASLESVFFALTGTTPFGLEEASHV